MRQKNNRGSHTSYLIPHTRSAFTLIEILIVVAIIAILASVVLIGLGPTQELGRDSRRLSDLREVQTGLELYYGDCGYYPGLASCGGSTQPSIGSSTSEWAAMASALTGSPIGVNQVPNDPSSNKTYYYESYGGGVTYVIGAMLEDANNSAFVGYQPPTYAGSPIFPAGMTTCANSSTTGNYCLSL